MILAIDPGTTESGFVVFAGDRVRASGVLPNAAMLDYIVAHHAIDILAIEKIEAMGMAVGAEVFETVHWSGRFLQAWHDPDAVVRCTRRAVKLHLCGSARAKDPNIRQALLDTLGPVGIKSNPGPCYGVKSHAWAALAVAVTVAAARDANAPAPGLFAAEQPAEVF